MIIPGRHRVLSDNSLNDWKLGLQEDLRPPSASAPTVILEAWMTVIHGMHDIILVDSFRLSSINRPCCGKKNLL